MYKCPFVFLLKSIICQASLASGPYTYQIPAVKVKSCGRLLENPDTRSRLPKFHLYRPDKSTCQQPRRFCGETDRAVIVCLKLE